MEATSAGDQEAGSLLDELDELESQLSRDHDRATRSGVSRTLSSATGSAVSSREGEIRARSEALAEESNSSWDGSGSESVTGCSEEEGESDERAASQRRKRGGRKRSHRQVGGS